MGFDYDRLYAKEREALGAPTEAILRQFDRFDGRKLRILDVGCGQGRDALPLARRGHAVVAVDLSPHGIRDLEAAAAAGGLEIEAIVADIETYHPEGLFGAVLCDRTLHMLAPRPRREVLARLLGRVAPGGVVVIADEPRNVDGFIAAAREDPRPWDVETRARGLLVLRQAA